MRKVIVIIPARYNASRLPGKPLIQLAGQPLIVHVVNRAKMIPLVDEVIVATDDERIMETVQEAGETAVLTPDDIPTGSDRVGWVARDLDAEIVVNLQGDEPLVDTEGVHTAIEILHKNSHLHVATLGFPLTEKKAWEDPNLVKVITDKNQYALYFSRRPIPYFREVDFQPIPCLYQHIGVYIYRKDFLLEYLSWEPSPLERAEKLEQLRILSHGYSIYVVEAKNPSWGVDTPEDIEFVEKMLK